MPCERGNGCEGAWGNAGAESATYELAIDWVEEKELRCEAGRYGVAAGGSDVDRGMCGRSGSAGCCCRVGDDVDSSNRDMSSLAVMAIRGACSM